MIQQHKALQGKVVIGYLLLFAIAVFSVWFIYTEILKIAIPERSSNDDNKKIILLSNAVAGLYAAEAVGRNSILTGSSRDFAAYNVMLDSVNLQIDNIKKGSGPKQLAKLDTIQDLLQKKRSSINEILAFRKAYDEKNTFDRAVGKIYKVKDSLVRNVQPVQFRNNSQLRDFLNNVLTKKQLDSLNKLPVSNDELTSAIEKMLTGIIIRDNKIKYALFRKEQKLQDENRIISDQLRIVISSLEKEIIQNSYAKLNQSKSAIDNIINTMAWIGAVTLCLLLLFAWIIVRDLKINQDNRKELELLHDEKEDLLRSKTMLLATVTHDIQTPLGSVIGFSDLMKTTGINEKQHQYLDNIKHSAQYIVKLANDLTDFSKLENNKISIEKVPFNFKALIESTCEPLVPNALKKHIELSWEIDDALDANFISDPYRLKQILTNLVSNAIKFTQEGSVEVVAKTESNSISIAVIDTGIGIAAGQQEAVFKEFTQAHSGIEKKFGGTGLGLTIAKRMLNLLDGKIELESVEGQGSVFTITIPLQRSETPGLLPENKVLDVSFLAGRKILVVDDDTMQLTLMEEIFANYPVQLTVISDASEVEQLLEKDNFDLVLTDIQMPKMDGFELLRIIRNNPEIAAIPVIALSGKRDLNPEDYIQKGFTASHPKPIQLENLLLLLQSVLETGKPIPILLKEKKKSAALFDLSSLNQFTQHDPHSLKMILETFIGTANDNKLRLQSAAAANDLKAVSDIAHKMLPMLRQMEVHSLVDLLEPLENQASGKTAEELLDSSREISAGIEELIVRLRLEIQ